MEFSSPVGFAALMMDYKPEEVDYTPAEVDYKLAKVFLAGL